MSLQHARFLQRCSFWLLLILVCAAIVIVRRPDVVMNPQFWAEDGKVWFANANNLGVLHSLLLPQNGYLQTVSRLVAAVATVVPIKFAPLVFNLAAVAIQILPVMLLNGKRGRVLVPSTAARIVISLLYLAQPYTTEVHANLTNAQWHLAVSAALVLCFKDWRGKLQKMLDVSLFALFGLSGPFCILLLPVAAWLLYRRRDPRTTWLVALLAVATVIQTSLAIPQMGVSRAVAPLGASWEVFTRVTGGQIVLAGLLGNAWTHVYLSPYWREAPLLPLSVMFAGIGILARAMRSGSTEAACFISFTLLVFGAALLSPQLASTAQWEVWQVPHAGERYSFLPILGLYVALVVLVVCDSKKMVRRFAVIALGIVFIVAIPASWRIRPFQDLEFQRYADEYLRAQPGDVVRIPLNPPGWFMELRKQKDDPSQ